MLDYYLLLSKNAYLLACIQPSTLHLFHLTLRFFSLILISLEQIVSKLTKRFILIYTCILDLKIHILKFGNQCHVQADTRLEQAEFSISL